MKKWISLFDLCPIRPGMCNDRAARITAMSYLRDCLDKEHRMERQLLNTSEYILLRGKDSFNGLLQRVETNPVSRISGQTITDLYNSVPKTYRKNAVFLMNVVTLNELSRSLDADSRALLSYKENGTFTLMDKPVVLCNAMPFIRADSVPILFGDFSKVSISGCKMHPADCQKRLLQLAVGKLQIENRRHARRFRAILLAKSLPYTSKRPGEPFMARPVRECTSSKKCLQHFFDTLVGAKCTLISQAGA